MGNNHCKEIGISPTSTLNSKDLETIWKKYDKKNKRELSYKTALKFSKDFAEAAGVKFDKDKAKALINQCSSPALASQEINTELESASPSSKKRSKKKDRSKPSLNYDQFEHLFFSAVSDLSVIGTSGGSDSPHNSRKAPKATDNNNNSNAHNTDNNNDNKEGEPGKLLLSVSMLGRRSFRERRVSASYDQIYKNEREEAEESENPRNESGKLKDRRMSLNVPQKKPKRSISWHESIKESQDAIPIPSFKDTITRDATVEEKKKKTKKKVSTIKAAAIHAKEETTTVTATTTTITETLIVSTSSKLTNKPKSTPSTTATTTTPTTPTTSPLKTRPATTPPTSPVTSKAKQEQQPQPQQPQQPQPATLTPEGEIEAYRRSHPFFETESALVYLLLLFYHAAAPLKRWLSTGDAFEFTSLTWLIEFIALLTWQFIVGLILHQTLQRNSSSSISEFMKKTSIEFYVLGIGAYLLSTIVVWHGGETSYAHYFGLVAPIVATCGMLAGYNELVRIERYAEHTPRGDYYFHLHYTHDVAVMLGAVSGRILLTDGFIGLGSLVVPTCLALPLSLFLASYLVDKWHVDLPPAATPGNGNPLQILLAILEGLLNLMMMFSKAAILLALIPISAAALFALFYIGFLECVWYVLKTFGGEAAAANMHLGWTTLSILSQALGLVAIATAFLLVFKARKNLELPVSVPQVFVTLFSAFFGCMLFVALKT